VISSDPAIAADIFVSGSDIYIAGALGASSMRPVYWKNATATELSSATEYGYAGGIALNGADVYAVGALATSGSQDDMGPVYWKNGVKTALTTAKATAVGSAMRVFVNEGDVYIVGYYTDDLVTPTYEIAAYWKNGTRVDLSPATGKATAVGIFINQQ
jgi:hypothetical protein